MGNVIKDEAARWAREVPYVIDTSITTSLTAAKQMEVIFAALSKWETQTLYRFVPKQPGDFAWIQYENKRAGNDSDVGRPPAGGARVINLGSNAWRQTAVHETGHAIGLAHEHVRSDRWKYVNVYKERIVAVEWNRAFEPKGADFEVIEPYDYDSTMHYGSTSFARPYTEGWPGGAGWSSATFYTLGGQTYGLFVKSSDGTTLVHKIEPTGALGAKVKDETWKDGWTSVAAYDVGGTPFLFALKASDGTVDVNKIEADGTIGAKVKREGWSPGWSDVAFFKAGGDTYLFALKTGTAPTPSQASVCLMNADGTVGKETFRDNTWLPGWTTAEIFDLAGKPYLFLLQEGSGDYEVHELVAGAVGTRTDFARLEPAGWSDVAFYPGASGTCLVLLNSTSGEALFREMTAGGKVGPQLDLKNWNAGWIIAEPMAVAGGTHCVFFLKNDGTAAIHQLKAAGTLGPDRRIPTMETIDPSKMANIDADGNGLSPGDVDAVTKICSGNVSVRPLSSSGPAPQIDRRRWSTGWSQAVPFTMGGKGYLFFLKEGGSVDIHAVAEAAAGPATFDPANKRVVAGEVGARVVHYDWKSGWTSACFFDVGGKTYLFLLKAGDGQVSISEMNADGTVGGETLGTTWGTKWADVLTFSVGGAPYLFLIKEDGTVSINELLAGGKVGQETFRETWSTDWTLASIYVAGGAPFLLLVKEKDGDSSISELVAGGIVGREVKREPWSKGWTHAVPFTSGGNPFVLFLMSGTGRVDINPVNAGGTFGARVHTTTLETGWTSVATFTVGSDTMLLTLKSG